MVLLLYLLNFYRVMILYFVRVSIEVDGKIDSNQLSDGCDFKRAIGAAGKNEIKT